LVLALCFLTKHKTAYLLAEHHEKCFGIIDELISEVKKRSNVASTIKVKEIGNPKKSPH
jgi:hypothetical protein